ISAPVEDLVTPDELKFDDPSARLAALPCYFLEDLWVGYRLDIREETHAAFSSIHSEAHKIKFSLSGHEITGSTEYFIDREQPDDESVGHTSTELTVYNGLTRGQAKDYMLALRVPIPQPLTSETYLYKSDVIDYGASEALWFGGVYEYRL